MHLAVSEVNSLKAKFFKLMNGGGQQGWGQPSVPASEWILREIKALQAASMHLQTAQDTRHQLVPPQATSQCCSVEEPEVIKEEGKHVTEVVVAQVEHPGQRNPSMFLTKNP